MLNLDGSDDEFYRYTMDNTICSRYGKNNKLYLSNIVKISEQIKINVDILVKYISIELCTTNGFDKNKNEYWINSSDANSSIIEKTIFKFINEFILCKKCNNPETYIKSKNNKLRQKCLSCGCRNKITSTHKITSAFISK